MSAVSTSMLGYVVSLSEAHSDVVHSLLGYHLPSKPVTALSASDPEDRVWEIHLNGVPWEELPSEGC